MRSLRITLEYDGTRFFGWQTQREKPTVQETVEEAIQRILGERVTLHGSGRTDRGAHAAGQTAHFSALTSLPLERIQAGLNAVLPADIAVTAIQDAEEGFHARFLATSKSYRYHILNRPVRSPLRRDRTHHVPEPLDLEQMRKGASYLLGEHDFRAFQKEGGEKKSAVRRILRIDIQRKDDEVTVEVEATGFLYTMVRAIVGCLIRVGHGRWGPAEIGEILESGDRERVGPQTAPARGLYLLHVIYDDGAG
ncbi:MAG: tRNA pseudouridine(38-40) synthase TruA [Planctomycetota bacterium]|nr:tRNA pseudouridine(38-40) synthase TruA [Planctomycetota bacterium]